MTRDNTTTASLFWVVYFKSTIHVFNVHLSNSHPINASIKSVMFFFNMLPSLFYIQAQNTCLQQSCSSFHFIAEQLPCGFTPIPQSRVVGGQDAKPGAWPWQVQINIHDMKLFHYVLCSAYLSWSDSIVTIQAVNWIHTQPCKPDHDHVPTKG